MMSELMQQSYNRMMTYVNGPRAVDCHNHVVMITTEDSSFFKIRDSKIFDDDDYIWVICEHYTDMIFHKGELLEYCEFPLN